MPTPSEPQRKSEFGVGSSPPRRSIFRNYRPSEVDAPVNEVGSFPLTPALSPGEREKQATREDSSDARRANPALENVHSLPGGEGRGEGGRLTDSGVTLQSSIDTALARTFIYRLLAKAYENPEPDGWHWLCSQPTQSALWSAAAAVNKNDGGRGEGSPAVFETRVADLLRQFRPDAFDDFHSLYVTCFGHTVRGDCPMNEIEYGDIKADPLFQPHRLADLGAFYAAFGLEMTPDAAERQDHISIELEFMSVLAAKEAYALEHQLDDEQAAICRDAQKQFLREHLGRWTPAFTRRLGRMAGDTALGALADMTLQFITEDCARFGVTPGSEDLLLRPIDESSETICASCGIMNLPPGAFSSPVES